MPETQKKTYTPAEIAQALNNGCKVPGQVEEGATWGRTLAEVLRRLDWVDFESHSYCKVASFEAHLKKGHRKVEIISASFMGVFTEVRVHDEVECARCLRQST